jgi:hypothetical protein
MTAELPWGIVTLGKRKSVFGMGMYYNGEETRSSESLSLTAPYGPLRFGISFYPHGRFSPPFRYRRDAREYGRLIKILTRTTGDGGIQLLFTYRNLDVGSFVLPTQVARVS